MEEKFRIIRARDLFQLAAIFADKEIIDICFVTMYLLVDFKCVTGFRFIAPNKIDLVI